MQLIRWAKTHRTYGTHKILDVFPYSYLQYLILFTMVSRKSRFSKPKGSHPISHLFIFLGHPNLHENELAAHEQREPKTDSVSEGRTR